MRFLLYLIFLFLTASTFADVPNHSRQNTTLTYHYDFRGSTVALTDGSGHVTDRMEYSRYATTTFRTGTNDTPFLFNGRYGVQTDPNGLLSMRTRSYNPYLCRFINADPSGFSGGLNFYAYANGNPVSNVDPFGLASMGENSGASWTTRLLGAGQALGGLMMTVIGGETAETVIGLGAVSYGQDQFYAGMRTMMTGQPTPTVLEETLEDAGMSPTAAGWTSAGIGMVLPFGAEGRLVTGSAAGEEPFLQVTPPAGNFGSGNFGNAMHEAIRDELQSQFADVEFEFNIRPGQNGVDVIVPDEHVETVGFKYGEIKPNTTSSQNTFNRQVENWKNKSTIPKNATVQPITYDANGNVNLGFRP